MNTISSPLHFERQEFEQILGQCRCIAVGPAGRFNLRAFLVRRLQEAAPSVAAKVEGLDERQLRDLKEEIVRHQDWTW